MKSGLIIPGSVKAARDPYFANVSLLLHGNGANEGTTFTDNSINAFSLTAVGNAQTSTAQSKFNGSSLLFDNTGDALNIASPSSSGPLDLSSGDLTIEFYVQRSDVSGVDGLFIWGDDFPTSYGAEIYFSADALIVSRNTGIGILSIGSLGMSNGTWYHFAITKSGSTWTVYKDGTSIGTETTANGLDFSTTRFRIGGTMNYATNGSLNGYLAEIRITKGVARTITVPIAPYPNS